MDSLTVLRRLGAGELLDDLAAALTDVAAAVVEGTNSVKGTVTVTFTLERVKDEPAVMITQKMKKAPPARSKGGSLFYAVDGVLSRDDPRQATLEFRVVEPVVTERTVDAPPIVARELAGG